MFLFCFFNQNSHFYSELFHLNSLITLCLHPLWYFYQAFWIKVDICEIKFHHIFLLDVFQPFQIQSEESFTSFLILLNWVTFRMTTSWQHQKMDTCRNQWARNFNFSDLHLSRCNFYYYLLNYGDRARIKLKYK